MNKILSILMSIWLGSIWLENMEQPLLDKSMIKNLLLSFTDYNVKKESRKIIYVTVIKFKS